MPRDMRGTGRYPPQPRFPPFAFYSAVRLGDPELLFKIMSVDPYFITQDNGAGAPLHFAVTYRQLDMAHHLLNNGAVVNQRDPRGWTPLHRAAHLAHLDGYLEIYEYLLSRGADPSLLTSDYDPYLNPGRKSVIDVAVENEGVRETLRELNDRYSSVPKCAAPHPDIGDWWVLYDYGLEEVTKWREDYKHPYPEEQKRRRDKDEAKKARQARKAAAAAAMEAMEAQGFTQPFNPAIAGQVKPAAGALSTTAAAAVPRPPTLPVALLFPGQGSQSLGMISSSSAALPAVSAMLREANEVLGYDIMDLITQGPKSQLDSTVFSQPALFVTNLVAFELLRSQQPQMVERCRVMAGLSLGEYSALVAAGAMSFKDGIKVVKARAEAMCAAAGTGSRSHGMLSVVGLSDADLNRLCSETRQQLGGDTDNNTVCQLSNFLFPQGRVVSGHVDALDRVAAAAQGSGALKTQRLAVSGAFHTRLMEPARDALMKVLSSVEIRSPRVPVISNVTAGPFPDDPAAIRDLLGRQLVEPVRWEDTLTGILKGSSDTAAAAAVGGGGGGSGVSLSSDWCGCSELYELGPGHQIKAMVRRISQTAWKEFKNVQAA